jgi:hypothetical protein
MARLKVAQKQQAQDRIMYVCTRCVEECPDSCGHFNTAELVVMPDGQWLCEGCYDDERRDGPPFRSLPHPTPYAPAANQ